MLKRNKLSEQITVIEGSFHGSQLLQTHSSLLGFYLWGWVDGKGEFAFLGKIH
jgi:hypothetical protein